MIEIAGKLKPGSTEKPREQLIIPFELRQKRRLGATLASGESVSLRLPRGERLRAGDLLATADGRVVEVVAACERLLQVRCATPGELARAAYHLGNRHVPVEIGAGCLRLPDDRVCEKMLRGLGAILEHIEAPFEPEAGAYGHSASHAAGEENHGAVIHEHGAANND